MVGRHSEDLVESFKRTKHYNRQDFQLVQAICRPYETSDSLLTTPHVLTEVSNLLGQLEAPADDECRTELASFATTAVERFVGARDLASRPSFVRFGIADAAIERLVSHDIAVFTDDFALAGLLRKSDVPVLNLRVMRSYEQPRAEL